MRQLTLDEFLATASAPYRVHVTRQISEWTLAAIARTFPALPKPAPVVKVKSERKSVAQLRIKDPYGPTWREVWAARKEDRERFPPRGRKKVRAKARSARAKAKDCRTVPGIEYLALDPCVYCNASNPTTHDHIVPFSKGGAHDLSNLVRCCWACNKEKGTRSLLVFLARRAAQRAVA